jgi:hypothetical protein
VFCVFKRGSPKLFTPAGLKLQSSDLRRKDYSVSHQCLAFCGFFSWFSLAKGLPISFDSIDCQVSNFCFNWLSLLFLYFASLISTLTFSFPFACLVLVYSPFLWFVVS